MHQVLYSAFVTLLDEGRVKAARLESGTSRLYFDLKAQTEVASASATAATAATAAAVAVEAAASSSAPVTAQVSPAAAAVAGTPAASTSGPSAAAAPTSSAVTVPHRMQRHAYIKVCSASGALVALIRAAGAVAGQRLLSSGRQCAGTPLALLITSTVRRHIQVQITLDEMHILTLAVPQSSLLSPLPAPPHPQLADRSDPILVNRMLAAGVEFAVVKASLQGVLYNALLSALALWLPLMPLIFLVRRILEERSSTNRCGLHAMG